MSAFYLINVPNAGLAYRKGQVINTIDGAIETNSESYDNCYYLVDYLYRNDNSFVQNLTNNNNLGQSSSSGISQIDTYVNDYIKQIIFNNIDTSRFLNNYARAIITPYSYESFKYCSIAFDHILYTGYPDSTTLAGLKVPLLINSNDYGYTNFIENISLKTSYLPMNSLAISVPYSKGKIVLQTYESSSGHVSNIFPSGLDQNSIQTLFLKSPLFNKYKITGLNFTSVVDRSGKILVFYEKNGNISCATSNNQGQTWSDYNGIIRLLIGEKANYPKAFISDYSGLVVLTFILNERFLAFKEISTNLFVKEDAFQPYYAPLSFPNGTEDQINLGDFATGFSSSGFPNITIDDNGLQNFSLSGRALRKTPIYIVYGDNSNLPPNIDVIVQNSQNGLLASKNLSPRIIATGIYNYFNTNAIYSISVDIQGKYWIVYTEDYKIFKVSISSDKSTWNTLINNVYLTLDNSQTNIQKNYYSSGDHAFNNEYGFNNSFSTYFFRVLFAPVTNNMVMLFCQGTGVYLRIFDSQDFIACNGIAYNRTSPNALIPIDTTQGVSSVNIQSIIYNKIEYNKNSPNKILYIGNTETNSGFLSMTPDIMIMEGGIASIYYNAVSVNPGMTSSINNASIILGTNTLQV